MTRRPTRLRAVLVAAAVVAVAPLDVAGAQEDAPPQPTGATEAGHGAPGDRILVTGDGWPANAVVQVELCGNEGLDGSADCDRPRAQAATTSAEGQFSTRLEVGIPPRPCPCIVMISSLSAARSARVPFEVDGAAMEEPRSAALDAEAARQFTVESATVLDDGPWTAWFGAAPNRTLELVVRNSGNVSAAPRLTATWGRSPDPAGVMRSPEVPELDPGEAAVIEIPVPMSALSIGGYVVEGTVRGGGEALEFSASTDVRPWGLLLLALVPLQLAALSVRNRVRRRIHERPNHLGRRGRRSPAELTSAGSAQPEPEPEPVVVDLTEPEPEPEPVVVDLTEPEPEPVVVDLRAPEDRPEPMLASLLAGLAEASVGPIESPAVPAPAKADARSDALVDPFALQLGPLPLRSVDRAQCEPSLALGPVLRSRSTTGIVALIEDEARHRPALLPLAPVRRELLPAPASLPPLAPTFDLGERPDAVGAAAPSGLPAAVFAAAVDRWSTRSLGPIPPVPQLERPDAVLGAAPSGLVTFVRADADSEPGLPGPPELGAAQPAELPASPGARQNGAAPARPAGPAPTPGTALAVIERPTHPSSLALGDHALSWDRVLADV